MITLNDISMNFTLATDHVTNLKEFLVHMAKGKLAFREFKALENISFTVNKGEVVGIIGANGAGKSTLLKIISGIMTPTKGNVEVKGTISPMLELGAGFDPDLSARENIFLNGAVLGYSKSFLQSKYDEIVEFSELADFIENPIRNFSSGMIMRLAFAIATVVDPDVLIIDEILSVGDAHFQKKSERRMKSMITGGTTVLLVSHSLEQIRSLCQRTVWLNKGRLQMAGRVEDVCGAYEEFER